MAELSTDNLKQGDNFTYSYCCYFLGESRFFLRLNAAKNTDYIKNFWKLNFLQIGRRLQRLQFLIYYNILHRKKDSLKGWTQQKIPNMWCVLRNRGLGWKSKLFSRAKNVKKSEKAHFLKLKVWLTISQTLYELWPLGLVYSTHYNQYLMILHYLWLRGRNKLFCGTKKWKSSLFGTPSSTSDFSDPIWARAFWVGLFDSL